MAIDLRKDITAANAAISSRRHYPGRRTVPQTPMVPSQRDCPVLHLYIDFRCNGH